jgi:hypothetical protein
MSGVFKAVPAALTAFSTVNQAVGATVTAAGSADAEAMLAAAAAALGPIGASFLTAYAPAQAGNLAATLLLGQLHAGIGGATAASNAAVVAADNS